MPIISKTKEKTKKLLFIYLVIMSFEYIVEYYSGVLGISWAQTIFRVLTIFVAAISMMFFFQTSSIVPRYNALLTLFFFFNLGITLVYAVISETEALITFSVLVYFPILLALGTWMIQPKEFDNAFKIISIAGIAVAVITLATNSIDIASALRRGYAWSEIFFYGSVYWGVVPIVLYCFIVDKWRMIAIGYMGSAVVFNMIFLKRYIFVDVVLVVAAVCMVDMLRKKKGVGNIIIVILVAVIGIFFFNQYQDYAIWDLFFGSVRRITESDISTFDRFEESKNYFSNSTFFDLVLGRGFAGQHYNVYTFGLALHVGWGNFLLKGGLLFFLLMFMPVIRSFDLFSRFNHYDSVQQWYIVMVTVESLRLFYTNKVSFSPELFMFIYGCINVMNIKRAVKTIGEQND